VWVGAASGSNPGLSWPLNVRHGHRPVTEEVSQMTRNRVVVVVSLVVAERGGVGVAVGKSRAVSEGLVSLLNA
jgi:hypothetical protein